MKRKGYKVLIQGYGRLPTFNIVEAYKKEHVKGMLFHWYNPFHWFIRLITPILFRHRTKQFLKTFEENDKR